LTDITSRAVFNAQDLDAAIEHARAALAALLRFPVNPDLSSGLMAGAEGRLAPFVSAILASGYDNGPAAGPVAGVP
jgi:hypothetical protein